MCGCEPEGRVLLVSDKALDATPGVGRGPCPGRYHQDRLRRSQASESLIEGVYVRTPVARRSYLSPLKGAPAKDPSVCSVPVYTPQS